VCILDDDDDLIGDGLIGDGLIADDVVTQVIITIGGNESNTNITI